MRIRALHQWEASIQQAHCIQEQLRQQVICEDRFGAIRYVAGTDVAFDKSTNLAFAAVVILEWCR